jgi:hypothetical protein
MRRSTSLVALAVVGCSGAAETEADTSTSEAIAISIDEETAPRPKGGPESWVQPPSDGYFGQWGYCGATAAANLFRWYGREVAPREAVDKGCWSYIAGTFPGTLRSCMNAIEPDLECALASASLTDPLGTLRGELAGGHPVIILYMTGVVEAHWVVVTGIEGEGHDRKIVAMSDGRYIAMKWSQLAPAWGLAYDGPFPMISCQAKASSPGLHP